MQLGTRLSSKLPDTTIHWVRLSDNTRRIVTHTAARVAQKRQAFLLHCSQLELLNPQRTLERGYAIVIDAKGRVVRTPKDLQPREVVTMRLAEGTAIVGIASVQPSLE
jgi:exodeoxyribonuclease VII large subunit